MEKDILLCKECKRELPRSAFRNVANPEMCKECISERKRRRSQVQQVRRKGSSQSIQNTLHLSPFHTAILQVLSLNTSKSQIAELALEKLFDEAPQHLRDFIKVQEKVVLNQLGQREKVMANDLVN